MKNLIFLDMDGVMNNQTFEQEWKKEFKKNWRKEHPNGPYLNSYKIRNQFEERFAKVSEYSFYNGFIAPENLDNWNKLITSVEAEIVCSSDWRRVHFETGDMLAHPNMVQELFDHRGMKGKVIGVTPMESSWHRGAEIHRWLSENNSEEERRVLVLDDLDEVNDFDYGDICTEFKFINTDYMKGLTSDNVNEAIKFLNRDAKMN